MSALHAVSLDKCVTAKQDVSISCKFPRATYTSWGNCIMHNPRLTYVICSVWPGAVDLITHRRSTVPAGNSSTSLHYIYSSWKKSTTSCNNGGVLFFFCAIVKKNKKSLHPIVASQHAHSTTHIWRESAFCLNTAPTHLCCD